MRCTVRFSDYQLASVWMSSVAATIVLVALLAEFSLSAGPASAEQPQPQSDTAPPVDYDRDIAPILEERCFGCHGADTQESGLRLDRRGHLLRGGETGEPAAVVGRSDRSELIRRVTAEDELLRMPPDDEPLAENQIALLRRWIDQGLKWSANSEPADDSLPELTTDFWSFQPIEKTVPPSLDDDWITNPVDAFVLARLRKEGIEPSPQADRRTRVRRLYLDMLGLPPTPAEVDAFSGDTRPDAYERLVDRVLASPHYGQRWARHWLDVVRYAETDGFEMNQERPTAWRYRDYVVESFNADKPYDRFVIEQLAGDATGVPAATGFLVGGAYDKVKSPDKTLTLMQRQDELADMVNTSGTAFLGLTLGCARCHNHKFDPVLQKDYYAFQAVFAGVKHGERPLPGPTTDRLQEKISVLDARIAALEKQTEQNSAQAGPAGSSDDNSKTDSRTELDSLRADRNRLNAAIPRMYAGVFEEPSPTHRLYRGDPMSPREVVAPDALAVLASLELSVETSEQDRRLALARWITSPDHPLTARVMVNRLWHYHFGTGLVATPSDFGANGAGPSHPQLLDWLAGELVRSGWSLKHVHRLILLSSTYRQSSAARDDCLRVDAGSRLLWRYPPRRISAETIRDCMLAVTGALEHRGGGPGFSLFEPNNNYVRVYQPKENFGPAEFRRMIYLTKVRMETDDVFGAFDCPDAGQVQPRRSRSITAIQALNLYNSEFVVQQASLMAARLRREAGSDVESQVQSAFLFCFGREPQATESQAASRLVTSHGLPALCRALFNTNEFLFVP